MPKRREVLGNGTYGVVYGTSKYAIKQIDDKVALNTEHEAYCALSQDEHLRGRIPAFHGIDPDQGFLYLQRINEPTLRHQLPDESNLLPIQQTLLETIGIVHEHGWCHGDIRLDNVFASGLLFDFSHARPKNKLSAHEWERFQKKDRRDIQRCYLEAIGLKKLEAASALLDVGVDDLPRQSKLAELLRQSNPSPGLLDKLEKIPDPSPPLALEMCAAFRRGGRRTAGMRLLRAFRPPAPCDDPSRRLHVRIQLETALCESFLDGERACGLFVDAVRSSIDLLGPTDADTVRLRLAFAEHLEESARYSGALDVIAAIKTDGGDSLYPWEKRVVRMEERLRAKRSRKRGRERPMEAEPTLAEDGKENGHECERHGPSKKPKQMGGTGIKKNRESEGK